MEIGAFSFLYQEKVKIKKKIISKNILYTFWMRKSIICTKINLFKNIYKIMKYENVK